MDDYNYFGDYRVRAGERGMDRTPTWTDDDGVKHELPWRYEVCPVCHGNGTHVNPSIDAGGLGWDDMDDPDFRDDYMSGVYDVLCYGCKGERVVPTVDTDRCDPEILKGYQEEQEALAEDEAIRAAERRMGA